MFQRASLAEKFHLAGLSGHGPMLLAFTLSGPVWCVVVERKEEVDMTIGASARVPFGWGERQNAIVNEQKQEESAPAPMPLPLPLPLPSTSGVQVLHTSFLSLSDCSFFRRLI